MQGRAVLTWLMLAGSAVAAPAPPPLPAPTPEARVEADRFAQQLLGVVNQITEQYIRPIAPDELLHAAAVGLYDAARVPVPPKLREELRKACDAPTDPFAGNRQVGAVLNDAAVVPLLARARLEAGRAETLRGQNLLIVACKGMTRALDPYSGVLTAAEYRRNAAPEEWIDGYGIELEPYPGNGPLRIAAVQPGSPAQRAGLRPGDAVTRLNEKPIGDYLPGTQKIESLLRLTRQVDSDLDIPINVPNAPSERSLKLTYQRRGTPGTTTVDLQSARYRVEGVYGLRRRDDNTWDFWLDRKQGIAHVRLGSLGAGSADELREALTRLESEGLRGLILDLRICPGGFLREALGCAGMFVGDVPVATVRARNQPEAVHRGSGEGKFLTIPLVVLVNGDTSGGGELIAAALQDHKRAIVVGQRTLGKASVQTPIHLGIEGVGMKLTSGTFLRPSGKNLHRFPESKPTDDWGVKPEPPHQVRISADLNRTLREWWLLQTLRPGVSSERLALDDPNNDPPRQAALQALERAMSLRK